MENTVNLAPHKSSARIEWVDLCKAVGICLVVIGHFLTRSEAKTIIYSFHVPFFFVLSGFVFNEKQHASIFLKKKLNTLILPYIIYVFFSLPYYFLPYYFFKQNKISVNELAQRVFMIEGATIWNSPLWFLPVMFSVQLISYLIFKYCPRMIHFLSIPVFMVVAYALYTCDLFIKINRLNIFGLNKAVFLFPFFAAGKLLKECKLIELITKKIKYPLICGLALFMINICVVHFVNMPSIGIYTFDLSKFWDLILTGIIGSFSVIIMSSSSKINLIALFKIINNHTIAIMCTHYYFLMPLLPIINRYKSRPLSILIAITVILLYSLFFWVKDKAMDKFITPLLTRP